MVLTFRDSAVTEESARQLLTMYFEERALGFPAGPFAYLRSFPRDEQFRDPDGVFLVVERDGADVGCGGIRRIESDRGARFEVKHLWLDHNARGHGFGRTLLEQLERRARGFGATELVLDTNASLAAASALYRSSGFVSVPAYNDNPNATHWYAKSL